jgi:stress response protein YsnF
LTREGAGAQASALFLWDFGKVFMERHQDQGNTGDEADSTVVPVLEERVAIHKRSVESGGGVRLRKLVHEEVVTVDEPQTTEVTDVERVAIGRPVDEAVPVRHEGDTMIVSVVEERLVTVTRKQLVLVEELRLTRRSVVQHRPQDVTLRREEVLAERLDPASGEWKPVEPVTGPSAHP